MSMTMTMTMTAAKHQGMDISRSTGSLTTAHPQSAATPPHRPQPSVSSLLCPEHSHLHPHSQSHYPFAPHAHSRHARPSHPKHPHSPSHLHPPPPPFAPTVPSPSPTQLQPSRPPTAPSPPKPHSPSQSPLSHDKRTRSDASRPPTPS